MSEVNLEKTFLGRDIPDDPTAGLLEEQIDNVFLFVARELKELVPPGREFSLVLTKLQEAQFWARDGNRRRIHEVK